MTIKEFEAKLNEKLEGKEYTGYGWQGTVLSAVVSVFEENGIPHDGKLYYKQYNNREQSVFIQYAHRVSVLFIEVKKAKGQYNRGYWGPGYYDWTFKKVIVDGNNPEDTTIEEAMDRARAAYSKALMADEDRATQAASVVADVRKKLGLSDWDAKTLFGYINAHWYSLDKLVEGFMKEE